MSEIKAVLNDIPLFDNVPFMSMEITALKGLSNKNYLLQYYDSKLNKVCSILRIPQAATNSVINRNNESYNKNLVYKLGFVPKTLWQNEQGICLTEYINNTRTLTTKDVVSFKTVTDIAEQLKELHYGEFSFKGGLLADDIAKCFEHYLSLCTKKDQLELKSDHQNILALCEKVKANDRAPVPSHGDLIAENILVQNLAKDQVKNDKIWIVDWEYSAMASPFWDLASLSNSLKLNESQSRQLLQLYFLEHSEADFKCLENHQQLEQELAKYWLKAFKPHEY